jgi:hypothetical protein
MKKYLLTILLGAFGAMILVAPALAATSVSFTPVSVSVSQGQSFTFTIGVNPQGVKNYTAKIEFHYPADLLEAKSFTFANGWMPLPLPGYDLIDNTNGVSIKTAGYPGGVSSPVTFGTVSFLAKKSGNGTIALSGNSFVLDANNQNALAGASAQTAVAISVLPNQTNNNPQQGEEQNLSPIVSPQENVQPGIGNEGENLQANTLPSAPSAAILLLANIISFGSGNNWISLLVSFVIYLSILGLAYWIFSSWYGKKKAKRNKQA